MAYTSIVQALDRLSVRSILRGSTATVAGVLATFALFVLCLVIYIPPARSILAGTYFQTQFIIQSPVSQPFYSNQDFKIAIVFRHKLNNSVANHTKIVEYAYSLIGEYFPDTWEDYLQPMELCSNNTGYFSDILTSKTPQDCFIFPNNALFNIYIKYGRYSFLYYQLFARKDPNPFSAAGNQLSGNQNKLLQLFQNYYYQVYFTSKIINRYGTSEFILHRFYSSDVEPTNQVTTSWNQLIYNVRNTTMDISIMPWLNRQDKSHLIWLGQMYNYYLLNDDTAAKNGVYLQFSYYLYQIRTFRYYKKIDFLAGVIGGAMLLFYIILWVPFNYINKTIHQIRNTQNLLLVNKGNPDDPIMQQDLVPAKASWKYWVSNPILNFFFPSFKEAEKLVHEAQRELDIVTLIKKLKIIERTLKKKNFQTKFTPKVLQMKFKAGESQAKQAQNSINMSETSSIMQAIQTQIQQQDFEQDQNASNNIFKLKIQQLQYLRESEQCRKKFPTHMTALAIRKDEDSVKYKELQQKNKWSAHYDRKVRVSKKRKFFNMVCQIIKKFDFFGAKPNLLAGSSGSSLVGICGIAVIIFLTCLTVGLTVSNANTRQYMIYRKYMQDDNFGSQLQLGSQIKIAVCSYSIKQLQGSNRAANFRFYHENAGRRTYFAPIQMTTADYALFGQTKQTAGFDIRYCFKMTSNQRIFMGNKEGSQGYFGYRIQPFCTSTPAYCTANAATINYNYLNFVNTNYVSLYIPQNRLNPETNKLINNPTRQSLNLDIFYLDNKTAMEQTLFLDHARIQDDTTNYFMRKSPIIAEQGISKNANTPYPISRIFNSTQIYYELKIKLSGRQTNYVISTPKADTIVGIIGGVFVIWYAICHWLGKVYNSYQVRAVQADTIYSQDSIQANLLMKFIAISPIPLCLIPKFYDIRNTICRMRQVDKKIVNDLHYLWLIKYVNNIFQLSSTLFPRIEAQNLSKVYIKQKIAESQKVVPQVQQKPEHQDIFEDQIMFQDQDSKFQASMTISNKISNISRIDSLTDKKLNQVQVIKEQQQLRNEKTQRFGQNYLQGNPKPLKFGWMDTFEYPSSLTFKGQRQVTSTFGGCCCLILLMFILIIVNFQVGIYLTRSDTKIGMTTAMMEPLDSESNTALNSKILFTTGSNFKLAVTFSKNYEDYPHEVSSYLTKGLGISIFKKQQIKHNGILSTTIVEYPMVPCQTGYLSGSINSLVDPAYFVLQELGYCAPDGLNLQISGLPQDKVRNSFTLSIYNKFNTTDGRDNIKIFLQNFYPKFHMTAPYPDLENKKIRYEIGSFLFDPYNITTPIQQNVSISKLVVTNDMQIDYEDNPQSFTTYNVHPFQQLQASYYGLPTQEMYYNLTFSNSNLVDYYYIQGDKFYQTFGIIGGIIAFFIFGFGFIARSFNQYRMRYLVGRQLYLFQISKKKKNSNKARGKLTKTQEQRKYLKQINNFHEGYQLRAYFLSFFGALRQNYNIDSVLRRITVIQQKVEKDLSLFEVYKKVHRYRDILNQQCKSRQLIDSNIADIFLMHIYNPDPQETHVQGKLKGYAKKYTWTAYQQQAIIEARRARVSLMEVFDRAFLEENFDINENASLANLSNLNPTIVSNTDSIGQSEIMSREEN